MGEDSARKGEGVPRLCGLQLSGHKTMREPLGFVTHWRPRLIAVVLQHLRGLPIALGASLCLLLLHTLPLCPSSMLRHGAACWLRHHHLLLSTAATAGWPAGVLLGASGGGWGAATQQQLQLARHRSDAAAAATAVGDASSFVHDPIDASALQLVEQADALVAVSSAATEAAVAAAQGSVWVGTRAFIDVLMWTHDSAGLPWFEAIALTNLAVKAAMLPLTIATQKTAPQAAKMRAESEQLQRLSKKMAQARSAGEYEMLVQQYREAHAAFASRNKGAMLKTLVMPGLMLGQAAVFISQFSALSTLATEKLPAMTHEGALWFSDLTSCDPFYGLPVICSAATLAMLHSRGGLDAMNAGSGMSAANAGAMKKVMSVVALAMIPLGGYASSAVALLWASNALIQAAQNLLLANARVRSALGLPERPAAAAPAAAAAAGSSEDAASRMLARLGFGSSSSSSASTQASPPPPGTKPGLAVNYVSHKPRKPRKR